MPVTILSWNVQNLGATKAQVPGVPPAQREIVDVLVQMILGTAADIVGIMEVQGGIGSWLSPLLRTHLNNARPPGAPYEWRVAWSARQDGGTEEEYLFLWKNQAGVLELDTNARLGPLSTIGVVDRQALDGFQRRAMLTDAEIDDLLGALQDSRYIFRMGTRRQNEARIRTFRVMNQAWMDLDAAGDDAIVNFAPPPARQPPLLTDDEREELAQILLDIDILKFVKIVDRAPYLAAFRVGTPAKPLLVGLYHALGPQNRNRFSGNNLLALSRPLTAASEDGNLLLMGDFNIAWRDMTKQCIVYTRREGTRWITPARPPEMVQVFAPITGAPLEATEQIGNAKTSVIEGYWPATEPYGELLASEYDKFFLHTAPDADGLATQGSRVVAALPMLSTNGAGYDVNLARTALTYYRALKGTGKVDRDATEIGFRVTAAQAQVNYWNGVIAAAGPPPATRVGAKRGRSNDAELDAAQEKLATAQTQAANVAAFRAMVATPVVQAVTGSGPALNVYRDVISDHLPILITLA